MPIGFCLAQQAWRLSPTALPRRLSECLRVLNPCVRPRHQRVVSWLLVVHLLYGERANLKARARHGPAPVAYHPDRRHLCAASWCTTTLLWWFVDQALQAFPSPEDGLVNDDRKRAEVPI